MDSWKTAVEVWQTPAVPGDTADRLALRVKLGTNEFEADGPPALVAAHFQRWQALIGAPPPTEASGIPATAATVGQKLDPLLVFAVDRERKTVSLCTPLTRHSPRADAALLLLYGFQHALGEDARGVLVTRLKAALSASGHPRARLARMLDGYRRAGLVKKYGRRKGSTYQLTARGSERAAAVMKGLIEAATPRD